MKVGTVWPFWPFCVEVLSPERFSFIAIIVYSVISSFLATTIGMMSSDAYLIRGERGMLNDIYIIIYEIIIEYQYNSIK